MSERRDEEARAGQPEEPEPGAEPASDELDLTESSALVFLSDSDVRRLEPDAQAPAPDDLTESSTFVFLSGSDVRRLETSGAGAAAPPPPPPRPPEAGQGAGPPPGGRRRAALLVWALVVLLAAALGYALGRRGATDRDRIAQLERERDRAVAGWKRVQRRLEQAREAGRRRLEAQQRKGREALQAAQRRVEQLAAELEAAREALERERDAFARARDEALRAQAQQLEREAARRAERQRLDLERGIQDTIARYEALLAEIDRAQQRFLALVRRQARAEIARREALLRQRFEQQRAEREAERQRELEAEAARIEARLREELAASPDAGGADEAGFMRDAEALFEEQAAEAGGVDLETEVWEHLRGHLGGEIGYRFYGYFSPSSQPEGERVLDQGRLLLRYRVELSEAIELLVAPRLRFDDGGLSRKVQSGVVDDEPRRPVLSFEEALVRGSWGTLDLELGEKIFAFGSADLYNPTDLIWPVDYTDLLDSEKIGVPALHLAWWPGGGDTALRLVWLPWFVPSRLPLPGERFFAFPPSSALPPVRERDLPPRTLGAGEFAVRAESRLAGFDVSLTSYYGWHRLPVLEPLTTASPPFVALEPRYTRRLVLGADFAREVGDFILAGELAQTFSESSEQDDFLQYVFGARRTFFPWDRRMTLSLEYAGEWTTAQAQGEAITVVTDLARAFKAALLTRVRFEPVDDLDLTLAGAWLLHGPDSFYVRPEARYRFGAHTELRLGLDLIDGRPGGFFDRFGDDDRVFVDFKVVF